MSNPDLVELPRSEHSRAEADPVRDFVRQHDLAPLVEKATELVRQHFSLSSRIELEVRRDPEEGDEWVLVRVRAPGTLDAIRDAYRGYLKDWVRFTPPDKRPLVRLSYGPA